MFHLAEETYAKAVRGRDYKDEAGRIRHALSAVTVYAQELARRHRLQQGEVDHWYEVCKVQFPLYVEYWRRHPDAVPKVNLLTETAFDVPYTLPSGRVVRLRGKWDSVDLVGRGKEAAVYLTDHKTKGDVDEAAIKRQLSWDLQTALYMVALKEWQELDDYGTPVRTPDAVENPIKGVFYNVIRRPLSGGKGSIVRHKATDGAKCPKCKGTGSAAGAAGVCLKCDGRGRVGGKPEEPKADYYARVKAVIEAEPEHFFMRWRSEVIASDVAAFRRETLDPVLENLCSWYEHITDPASRGPFSPAGAQDPYLHWRHPFGIYNPLDDGRETDVDEYLRSGSTAGLERKTVVFPELAV